MTKAERIFKSTYRACRKYIEDFGFKKDYGFSRLYLEDTDTVCTRTCNEVETFLNREIRFVVNSARLGAMDAEKAQHLAQALAMVKETLKNQREHLAEI